MNKMSNLTTTSNKSWLSALSLGIVIIGAILPDLVIVPQLLNQLGMNFTGAFIALLLTMIISSLCWSYYRLPYIMAPSVPITIWLVYLVGISQGLSYGQLLAVSLVSSLLVALFSTQKLASKVLTAIPTGLIFAMPGALGLLLIRQGLVQSRLLITSPYQVMMAGNLQDPLAYWSLVGIITTLVALLGRFKSYLLIGLVATTVITLAEGFWAIPIAPFMLPEGLDKTVASLSFVTVTAKESYLMIATGLTLLVMMLSYNHAISQIVTSEGDVKANLTKTGFISSLGTLLGSFPLMLSPVTALVTSSRVDNRKLQLVVVVLLIILAFAEPIIAAWADFPAMTTPTLVLGGLWLVHKSLSKMAPLNYLTDIAAWLPIFLLWLIMFVTGNIATALGTAIVSSCFIKLVKLFMLKGSLEKINKLTLLLSGIYLIYFLSSI